MLSVSHRSALGWYVGSDTKRKHLYPTSSDIQLSLMACESNRVIIQLTCYGLYLVYH